MLECKFNGVGMLETKINFQQVTDRVTAAQKMQEAHEDETSKSIMLKLADDIIAKLRPKTGGAV